MPQPRTTTNISNVPISSLRSCYALNDAPKLPYNLPVGHHIPPWRPNVELIRQSPSTAFVCATPAMPAHDLLVPHDRGDDKRPLDVLEGPLDYS